MWDVEFGIADWESMGHREIQLAAVLSSHRASGHAATPSLGHYASLSFVVIGGGQRTGWVYSGIRKLENWRISQIVKIGYGSPFTVYALTNQRFN